MSPPDQYDEYQAHLEELIREEEAVELAPREMQAIVVRACERVGIDPKLATELIRFRATLVQETDRGCALTGAAYLDELLRVLLLAYLVDDDKVISELFSGSGPLSSFSARIDLAYGMGLVAVETRAHLHLVRRIRNEFAHDPGEVKFERDGIKSRCGQLVGERKLSARQKFVRAVLSLCATLDATLSSTKHTDVSANAGASPPNDELFIRLSREIESADKNYRFERALDRLGNEAV